MNRYSTHPFYEADFDLIRSDNETFNKFIKYESDIAADYNDDDCSFGLWVSSLWTSQDYLETTIKLTNVTFEDQKEIFFRTFQHLLEEGKIIVVDPMFGYSVDENLENGKLDSIKDDTISNPQLETFPKDPRCKYWNAPPKVIVDHIRKIFPNNVSSYRDSKLNLWFYSGCPWIGWVDQETGEVTAS